MEADKKLLSLSLRCYWRVAIDANAGSLFDDDDYGAACSMRWHRMKQVDDGHRNVAFLKKVASGSSYGSTITTIADCFSRFVVADGQK